jgi:hypothetical protein
MVQNCSKCIQLFRMYKERYELIHDLKAKNEGLSHVVLKSVVCDMIRKWGYKTFPDSPISVETEVCVEGIGKVDVVARIGEATMAVECGNTDFRKVLTLKEHFDVVLHFPYCHTHELFKLDMDELEHQLFVAMILKRLKNHKLTKDVRKGEPMCLEEGECSLPSGRNGYPEEAMRIAGISNTN